MPTQVKERPDFRPEDLDIQPSTAIATPLKKKITSAGVGVEGWLRISASPTIHPIMIAPATSDADAPHGRRRAMPRVAAAALPPTTTVRWMPGYR